ncbi:unnamed protein product [Polarella glacialis]|uniref:WW domain-containing protein n=1 Tax=Polarella glacialis TaxID=89957 RepID=A0A813JZ58_POLGL|nr:unnamed protein product [Polarella glacialis]
MGNRLYRAASASLGRKLNEETPGPLTVFLGGGSSSSGPFCCRPPPRHVAAAATAPPVAKDSAPNNTNNNINNNKNNNNNNHNNNDNNNTNKNNNNTNTNSNYNDRQLHPSPVADAKLLPDWLLQSVRALGLDLPEDESLLWLAEHAVNAELPEDWMLFHDDDGRVAYYHEKTKRVTRQHPVLLRYRRYAQRLKAWRQRQGRGISGKVRAHVALVLNEVLNRCHKELPPTTPELLERTALLLGVDTAIDHALTTKLRAAMELFAEEQYDVSITVGLKADVDSFLTTLRNEQVSSEVLNKPEGIIMCSEFEERPASLKCEQCMDFFCSEGFAKTHAAGKRKAHTPLKVEQLPCSVYPHELATCEVDGHLFCDRGYKEAGAENPQLRLQHRVFLGGMPCSEYLDRKAEVLCEDCCDFFCTEAFLELHGHGHRQQHVALQLDARGLLWRKGQKLPPDETSKLLSCARLAREGGPWLAFRDDQLNSYWYHLSDKVVTHANPYFGGAD